ncbi:hypothetical protein LTS18_005639 [Coniosporium uncinatum]|uniref:Uncharacterized protein n=1 Tax=Coniosporium uncinatum TaxID=93489 RepID=A0ACC3DCH4_9PEZI|nr:hypothetical protein LTS18_005639 [Coniosporium uncinatum]
MSKPITLWSHGTGPNPWKVAIVLEELGVSYETKFMDFPDMKKEAFEKLNPNGRVPAIEDPNTGITLFESGAIIEYLIDTYDKQSNLTYTESPRKYQLLSWLHFQMSGQGPYFGQKAWFSFFHEYAYHQKRSTGDRLTKFPRSEKNMTSAIDRYSNEIKRVLGVVDSHLKKTGQEYLVGDKCTYADLAWVLWDSMIPFLMGNDFDYKKDYPNFSAWHDRVTARPAVAKVLKEKADRSK